MLMCPKCKGTMVQATITKKVILDFSGEKPVIKQEKEGFEYQIIGCANSNCKTKFSEDEALVITDSLANMSRDDLILEVARLRALEQNSKIDQKVEKANDTVEQSEKKEKEKAATGDTLKESEEYLELKKKGAKEIKEMTKALAEKTGAFEFKSSLKKAECIDLLIEFKDAPAKAEPEPKEEENQEAQDETVEGSVEDEAGELVHPEESQGEADFNPEMEDFDGIGDEDLFGGDIEPEKSDVEEDMPDMDDLDNIDFNF